MFAAVDLGSNSFRLHLGEYDGSAIKIVKSFRTPTRLAAGLDSNGYLTEAAMAKALECLAEFGELLSSYHLDAVRIAATNTIRIAHNSQEFLPLAEKAIGYPIEIISGEEEGRLIYMGVSQYLNNPEEHRMVIDIGGGSTEVILGTGSDIEQVESFGIGTHRHEVNFFGNGELTHKTFDAAILSARSFFEDGEQQFLDNPATIIYGSSGTIRVIAGAIEKNHIGDGTMSYDNLQLFKNHLISVGHIDQIELDGVKQERLSVMVSGLSILLGVMQEFRLAEVHAINAGLRMGLLWDLYWRSVRHDRRDQSVVACMTYFRVDKVRANMISDFALTIFAQLKPTKKDIEKYLRWSAMLHEVGYAISRTNAHKHSAYIVENADLPGFNTSEQLLMSHIVMGYKGNLKKIAKELQDMDFLKAVLSLRLAVICAHAIVGMKDNDLQIKIKNKIEVKTGNEWIHTYPTLSYKLNKEQDYWEQAPINMTFKSEEKN